MSLDPHLLTFEADIWYRLCLAQYVLDHGQLPLWDIRYEAYGPVPVWYPPAGLYFFAFLSKLLSLDLPTICSRVMPWIESFSILPMYLLGRELFNKRVAVLTCLFLQLSPSFVFWTGISTPQTLTLFLIPLMILLWIKFLKQEYWLGDKWRHLILMGVLMAGNFLFHLTIFNLIIILFLIHLALVLESQTTAKNFLYLLVPVALSQLLTIGWWLPNNLYFWWTEAITTSSALFEGKMFLQQYGITSALFGHLALLALFILILRRAKGFPPFYLLPILWALYPMIESHNEGILKLINRSEWVWVNIMKPLEGFRFYCFLAPPLALCMALCFDQFFQSKFIKRLKFQKTLLWGAAGAIGLIMLWDMFANYNLFGRFNNPSMQIEEIRAAHWFKANSKPTDRILGEYFTNQMFCGIGGGRALEGSMFPLKKVAIPYITEGWKVQQDIYSVYTTDDPLWIKAVLKRYGCTHVFYSQKAMRHIEYITQGDIVLDDIYGLETKDMTPTLFNPQYFKTIYQDGDIRILKWVAD